MQKSKSLLLKILMLVTVLCFAFVGIFGMAGCAEDGIDGVSIQSAQVNAEGKLEITLTDGTVIVAGDVKGQDGKDGEKGDKGDQGEQGIQGEQGVAGEKGDKGDKGDQGETGAAGEKGDKGDKGDQGEPGKDGADGKDGEDGEDGQSAYQLWLALGNTGSEADFLNWLKGEDGEDLTACAHAKKIVMEGDVYYDAFEDIETDMCGFNMAICLDCKDLVIVEFAHETEATEAKDSTCTEFGYNAGLKCKNCSYAEAGTIAKKEHKHTIAVAFEAIPENYVDGELVNKCVDTWYEGLKCETCPDVELTEKAATGHLNKEVIDDVDLNDKLNPCIHTWYTGEVCLDCGTALLVEHPANGHTYENIRVSQYATEDDKAILTADCSVCGLTNIVVAELPSLSEENDYVEVVLDKETSQASHALKYTATYEGVEYVVQPRLVVAHANLEINDYTAAKYPEIIFKTGAEAPNCATAVPAGYICEVCNKWIDSAVKTAHTLSEDVTEEVIKADVYAQHGCTTVDGEDEILAAVVVKYDCAECGAVDVISVNATQYGHIWIVDSITENQDGTIDVTFVCNEDASHIKTVEGITEFVKEDATCNTAGKITYTDATGVVELIIPATGDHACGDATHKLNANISYEDYLLNADKFIFAPGVEITCGSVVNSGFVCTTCSRYITVTIERQHKMVEDESTRVEPTCAVDGSVDKYCEYCDYTEAAAILEGRHDFEFVRMEGDKLIVKCVTENCPTLGAEQEIDVYEVESVTDKNCVDYKNGDKNYNKYVFTYTDDKEYEVIEYVENLVHQLNNKQQNQGDTLDYNTPGAILNGESEPANCKEAVDGVFVCELCNRAIAIKIKGTHAELDAQEVKEDAKTCEEEAYSYYICGHDGCDVRINITKVSDPLGHDVVATVNGDEVTFTCARGCDLNKTVKLADCTEVGKLADCEKISTTYTYAYVNGEFTQTFRFTNVVEVPGGNHDLIECVYEKVVDGVVVETVYGTYCKNCGIFTITNIEPPKAN